MKKRFLSILFAIVMIAAMMPVVTLPAIAECATHVDESGDNKCDKCGKELYVDRVWDTSKKEVVETVKVIPEGAIKLNNSTMTLAAGGWYYVDNTEYTISRRITVDGTTESPTYIIVKDGAKKISIAKILTHQSSPIRCERNLSNREEVKENDDFGLFMRKKA